MPRTADVEVGDRPLDARQKMLEARKIRNRESAYRSNERKKVREMRIEKDMQVLTEREMELREREQMLLEENRKLRAELGN